MAKVDTRRHIGDILISRGILNEKQLEKAMHIQDNESDRSPRRLGQILNLDLGLDRHLVMKAIADVFAFREIHNDDSGITASEIEKIKQLTSKLPKEVVDELMLHSAIPHSVNNNTLLIAATDPTDPVIPNLASKLPLKAL